MRITQTRTDSVKVHDNHLLDTVFYQIGKMAAEAWANVACFCTRYRFPCVSLFSDYEVYRDGNI